MKLKPAHIIGFLAVLFIPHAFSQSLLTEAYLTASGGLALITNSLNLTIGIAPDVSSPAALLFENLFVQTGDVGHTYTIDTDNDTDFATFVNHLTDGYVSSCSESVSLGPGGRSESGISEVNFFAGLPPGNNGIDLGGFEIDHVSLRFNALEIATPGSDPNRDGIWTDYSYSATFSVYGQPVPEPTSLAMLWLGVVALCAKTRWLTPIKPGAVNKKRS